EGVFVQILSFGEQGEDEVAAAYIMHQVAEKLAAERVIPHVLQDAPGVGVGMRLYQIFGSGCGEAVQQDWLNVRVPSAVDDGFVGQDRVRLNVGEGQQHQ